MNARPIELLAPARNAAIGREAILHGADAVYIGAPRFGARAAAGNSLDDIAELVNFAHVYGVRIYVTLNTLLFDDELDEAQRLVHQLYQIGVDALIVQDMALLEMDLPPIPLHASTQMDNRDANKVEWLHRQGFQQVVLARELTLEEIAAIHKACPDVSLEVFIHGATCVCYNGRCQASQYCFGRSANRGECAQFCRLPFDVVDAEGHVLNHPDTHRPLRQCHPLSLHDMHRGDDLEALLQAGAQSLKIEGRLKDADYVKNVVAYCRQRLNDIIQRHPDRYCRPSLGHSIVNFTPDPSRTFNRGFSSYFLHGRTPDLIQLSTPKSMGQYVGTVKEIRRDHFTVRGTASFSNGDGLCFVDRNNQLQGFRINRAEGNHLYPKDMPHGLEPRLALYRNLDQAFEQQLSKPTATRRIDVRWTIDYLADTAHQPSVILTIESEEGTTITQAFPIEYQQARTPQHDNIRRQLARLGDTPFQLTDVTPLLPEDVFIPSSLLAEWRREMTRQLEERLRSQHRQLRQKPSCNNLLHKTTEWQPSHLEASNQLARQHYKRMGLTSLTDSLELSMRQGQPVPEGTILMTTRYCLRYELGLCPKHHGAHPTRLYLLAADGRRFPLRFDCHQCEMQVKAPSGSPKGEDSLLHEALCDSQL